MERMSKDAAKVLYALHSQYQSRRKVGQSKADACQFGSCKSIHDDLCSDMPLQDVDESMRELDSVGYLVNDYGSDTITACYLTRDAIVDFERLAQDRVMSFLDFWSKVR